MAKKSTGIEIVEETPRKKVYDKDNACPICGAPNGKLVCEKCGWAVEELGADYSIQSGDPVQTLSKASHTFKAAKAEIRDLKLEREALLENNRKFTELVEEMEKELEKLRMEAGRKFVYSYDEGGWGETCSSRTTKIKLAEKKRISINDINKQLTEITRLLKHYKK